MLVLESVFAHHLAQQLRKSALSELQPSEALPRLRLVALPARTLLLWETQAAHSVIVACSSLCGIQKIRITPKVKNGLLKILIRHI